MGPIVRRLLVAAALLGPVSSAASEGGPALGLRTFGSDDAANREEFREFILGHPIRRWVPAAP